ADSLCTATALHLRRRAVGEIRAVTFARVNDLHAHASRSVEHALARRDHRLQRRDVVAQRFAEAARLDEVALHVDDDERGAGRLELEFVWLRLDRLLRHRAPRLLIAPVGRSYECRWRCARFLA